MHTAFVVPNEGVPQVCDIYKTLNIWDMVIPNPINLKLTFSLESTGMSSGVGVDVSITIRDIN